jgi:acylphosphatase
MTTADSDNHRVHLWASGRVQGVCFRMFTQREAQELGLVGWVRNLYDGRVEIVAEGARELLDRFVAWCRHGPPYAEVSRLEQQDEQATSEFRGFRIRY